MKLKYLHIVIIILYCVSCTTPPKRSMPKPEGSFWDRCSLCQGTGTITVSESKPFKNDIENRGKFLDSCVGNILSCVFIFQIFKFNQDQNPEHNYQRPDYTHSRYYDRGEVYLNRSNVEKEVECPRCSGKGWLDNDKEALVQPEKITEAEKAEAFRNLEKNLNTIQ